MQTKQVLAGMSLEEKVGQLFQVGFAGKEPTPEIERMILEYKIGGIILFSRNITGPEQIAALTRNLQKITKHPLLVSTDQEGGPVNRIQGLTHFPSNMVLGAGDDANLARLQGQAMGRELRACGINMNLAPVLDVNNNPANPVIGVRSYGEDPEVVARLGCAFISGLQEEGVASCGKHFPGHGDTEIDSHLALPVIEHGRERLEKVEFFPFRRAIAEDLESIMTAHVFFPAIAEKEDLPATLSRNVLTGLLREEMGFTGLIVTDCMEMKAISDNFGTTPGAIQAIAAGADMVLISHDHNLQVEAIRGVLEAIREGIISEERINSAVGRVLSLKGKITPGNCIKKQNPQEGAGVAREIAAKGITLLEDPTGLIPFPGNKLTVLEYLPTPKKSGGFEKTPGKKLVDILRELGLSVSFHSLAEEAEISSFPATEQILFCSYSAWKDPAQGKLIRKIGKISSNMVVAGLSSPYDVRIIPPGTSFITSFDTSPYSLQALAEVLTGNLKARGGLPVFYRKDGQNS